MPDEPVRNALKEGRATPRSHAFTITCAGDHPVTDQIANALYEAGCDDGTVGSCEGVLTVDFDRKAGELGDAIGSAVKDVERAGFVVARIEVESRAIEDREEDTAEKLTPQRTSLEKLVEKYPAPPEWYDEPEWTESSPETTTEERP